MERLCFGAQQSYRNSNQRASGVIKNTNDDDEERRGKRRIESIESLGGMYI